MVFGTSLLVLIQVGGRTRVSYGSADKALPSSLPEGTRPYDLRHTFATLMLEQGENPKVVQEALGHSRIAHTMDTYSHVSPNIQRDELAQTPEARPPALLSYASCNRPPPTATSSARCLG